MPDRHRVRRYAHRRNFGVVQNAAIDARMRDDQHRPVQFERRIDPAQGPLEKIGKGFGPFGRHALVDAALER